jgi:uncharacterized membrane protein YphA (DoxX/SURF4 family)
MTAEVFGAVGLFLGLFSRVAASGVLVVMLVARSPITSTRTFS